MRRKRLQHVADTLCHMFCGWRLCSSYPDLEKLGSGTLSIDVLTQARTFQGQPVRRLQIAGELAAWLHKDLAANRIDISDLREADLTADLRFDTVAKDQRATRDAHFDQQGHHLVPPRFLRCRIHCRAQVSTDEATYTSEYDDLEEWPSGWPARR